MTLRLNGSTSGYTGIDAPAVAGSNTLVLPTGNGSADQALVTNGSGTLSFADRGRMTLATAQNSTSGTSIDFTGIPSWVKRITVMFSGVSTSGTSSVQVQLGTGAGPTYTTSGYLGASQALNSGASSAGENNGSGMRLVANTAGTYFYHGAISIFNVTGNTWALSSILGQSDLPRVSWAGGSIALAAALTAVRITTVNGTDTFDAGSINILYEG